MKRIEFIAPVRAMRGNLGITQSDIVYPLHDNRAYDGPVGERNTARNYNPIIVGAERRNGKQYFYVRTKTTNHLTPLAKKSMAVMGAACSIYAAMKKDTTIAAKMDDAFTFVYPSLPPGTTDKSFFMEAITLALRNGYVITIYAGNKGFTVSNPFVSGESGDYDVTISSDILVKFWMELASNPIEFTVNGQKGIAHYGDTFADMIASHYNVLAIKTGIVPDGMGNVMIGDKYVCVLFGGEYSGIVDFETVGGGTNYVLTTDPQSSGG